MCRQTYLVLGDIARAEFRGSDSVIRDHVTSITVADRMIAFGRLLRRQHVKFLRVTPSFELTSLPRGTFQVGAYLVGQTKQGKIDDPEALQERVRGSTVVVTGDATGQEW